MKRVLLLIVVLVHFTKTNAQTPQIDSLKIALRSATQDTTIIQLKYLIGDLGSIFRTTYWDSLKTDCERMLKKYPASYKGTPFFKLRLADALNNIGYINQCQGNNPVALEYYTKSLALRQELGNKSMIAYSLNNFGVVYLTQGNVPLAVEYFTKSLKVQEEIGDKYGLAHTLNNLGNIYFNQGDFKKALENFEKSLKIEEEIDDKTGIAESLSNIAAVHYTLKQTDTAIAYNNKSLALRKELGDKTGVANSLNNIAQIYNEKGDVSKAIEYWNSAIEIFDELGIKSKKAITLYNIGSVYIKQKDYKKALEFSNKSMQLSKETGFPENIRDAALNLFTIYKATGNTKEALKNHELYIQMRDSLNNLETQKATIKQQTQYEFDKQKAIDEKAHEFQLKQQENKQIAEKTKQQIILVSVCVVLLLVVAFSIFLFNRFKVIQRQKKTIELKEQETHIQKEIIVEKHREITDSINYAGRIQRSFLATKTLLDENLRDYFVLFQPKDVVSGDFYWAAKLHNDQFALVTADSTGHGVPGAIMSLLNIMSLEKAIESYIKPSDILNSTRKTIIERLKKDGSEGGGKDGMDASFVVFDFENTKMTYAAANNPVWVVRKQAPFSREEGQGDVAELLEFKGDKMPIGKHEMDNVPFSQFSVDLQKGDVVYTITDGLPDQFGGPKGKKFMYKRLKELLISIAHLPMEEQRQLLLASFTNWKGDLEQVDDVCIIGVRV